MRLIASFFALTFLLGLGCAEQKPKGEAEAPAKAIGREQLFSTDRQHKNPVIRQQSGALEVEIRVPENQPKSVTRKFQIDPALVSPADANLELVLNELPFQFPTRFEGNTTWTIEFPGNTLEILSKEGRSSYAGTLHMKDMKGTVKKDLRVQLVLKRGTLGSAG